LDILRGLALFGVMAINIVFEFRVSIFEQFLPSNKITSPLDHAVEAFLDEFISLKAFALFSLLFGVGLAIQFDRLAAKRRAVLLLRRLMVLLAIGLVHLTLIWNGDILTEYALAGLVVLPFLFGPRWLLATGGMLFLGLYLTLYLNRLLPLPDTTWLAGHVLEAGRVYGTGSFPKCSHSASASCPSSRFCISGCSLARSPFSCSALSSGEPACCSVPQQIVRF
jgi:uncharacterized protein